MDKNLLRVGENYTWEKLRCKTENLRFINVKEEPFVIYGLYQPKTEPHFHRLPEDVAEATSVGVANLEKNPAGGRVRFRTDSQVVAIRSIAPYATLSPHTTDVSRRGFDLYQMVDGKEVFVHLYKTMTDKYDGYEGERVFEEKKMRELTIYFPLHNELTSLEIGLEEDAQLLPPEPYKIEKPIVYYGSSITHGACASRPGLSYEARISRKMNCNFINLGFSGNCKGEQAIVDYIASLDMTAFVCDYDHNAPNPEHLRNTHENVYRTVRAAHPNLPILLITKPDFKPDSKNDQERRTIVMQTYLNGKAAGDENLYFMDGASFFEGFDRGDCTLEGCHPNDHGFYLMAEKIGSALQHLLHLK